MYLAYILMLPLQLTTFSCSRKSNIELKCFVSNRINFIQLYTNYKRLQKAQKQLHLQIQTWPETSMCMPVCSATETSWKIEILLMAQDMIYCLEREYQRLWSDCTDATGWSAPFLFACNMRQSSFEVDLFKYTGFQLRVCTPKKVSYFSTETYVVGTQKNRLNETYAKTER